MSEERCFADSLNRAAGYTLDQTWIQFFTILLITFFPKHNKEDPLEQLLFALATTWMLCAVKDFIMEYSYNRNIEQQEQDSLRQYDMVKVRGSSPSR